MSLACPVDAPSFDWSKASLASWNKFESHCKLMFNGPLHGKAASIKCSYMLIWLGEKGREVFSTWDLEADELNVVDTYFQKFKEYITPQVNTVFARFEFLNRQQQDGEKTEDFITALKVLAQHCDYEEFGCDGCTERNLKEEMIRDKIVAGIKSKEIKRKLLQRGGTLSLKDVTDAIHAHETAQSQLEVMLNREQSLKVEIDAVKVKNRHFNNQQKPSTSAPRNQSSSSAQGQSLRHHSRGCYHCGRPFSKGHMEVCPAKGTECNNCGKLNHWKKVCHSAPQVHAVEEEDGAPETFVIHSLVVEAVESCDAPLYPSASLLLSLKNEESFCDFKLDTGSQANVISVSTLKKLFKPPFTVMKTNNRFVAYGGSGIECLGKINIECMSVASGKSLTLPFFIIKQDAGSILSHQACKALGLVEFPFEEKEVNSVATETLKALPDKFKEFNDVFQGIGKVEGKVSIETRPDVKPVVHPPRNVPLSRLPKLKELLDQREKEGVIRKVTKPTEWVNSLVTTEKADGSLRLCLDPKDLNEAIIRPHYPVPKFDDVQAGVHGHKYFTKLDITWGYWIFELTDEAADLTTFNTPFGRYQYVRMPFGLVCSQDIFMRGIHEFVEGLRGVQAVADDIVVSGPTQEEQDENLIALLMRARERNIRFNLPKSFFCLSSIPWFGNLLTSQGLKPDPSKLAAIENMPNPKSHEELATLIGMLNYLSRYIRDLSTLNQPLRELNNQENFVWTEVHSEAVRKIKSAICSSLAHFDPNATVVELTTDASQHGLGAHLSVRGEIVCYASHSLNKTEQDYSQIEKELFAIVFGCIKFHQLIFGRDVLYSPITSRWKQSF